MTATPIPRTVGMTLFGDLDVSTLARAAAGPAEGAHLSGPPTDQRERWWEFFRKKLREGRQGYVIAPLVEEAEAIEAANVQQTFEALCQRRAGRAIASACCTGG